MTLAVPAIAFFVLQGMLDPSIVWIWIPLTALAIPIVGILTGPIMLRMKQAERREARKLFERIVMEKLDVMKTAVAMGFEQNDLRDLDARLERLVGTDKLQGLLAGKDAPVAPSVQPDSELNDADLKAEIERLQRGQARE
jgi:hypothetical protein